MSSYSRWYLRRHKLISSINLIFMIMYKKMSFHITSSELFSWKKVRAHLNAVSQILRTGKGFLMGGILPIAEPLTWQKWGVKCLVRANLMRNFNQCSYNILQCLSNSAILFTPRSQKLTIVLNKFCYKTDKKFCSFSWKGNILFYKLLKPSLN